VADPGFDFTGGGVALSTGGEKIIKKSLYQYKNVSIDGISIYIKLDF